MVRFSCFTTHIPYHKSKKSVQQSVVEMRKELKLSQDQTPVLQSGFEISNPPHLQTGDRYIPGDSPDKITSPLSFDGCWKSEELNGNSYSEDTEGLHTISLKKSQSLGSGLDREGRISCGIDMEDETDRGLSANDSHEMIHDRIFEAFDGTSPQELHNHKEMMEDHGVVHNEHLFSIEDLNHSIEGSHQDFGAEQSVDHLVHSGDGTPRTPPAIAKSHSSPNFRAFPANSDVGSPSHQSMVARSKSFDDLCTPHAKRVEHTSGDEGVCLGMTYQKLRDESFNEEIPPTPNLFGNFSLSRVVSIEDCLNLHRSCQSDEAANQEGVFGGEDRLKNQLTDGCDSHNIDDSVNDWSVPRRNSIDTGKTLQQEPYVERLDELSRKNSNIRRIEEWISQIDFGNCSPVRECGECSSSVTKMKKETHLVTDAASAKLTAKVSPGMEGAYKYISSLTAVSTSAHMANLGLVAIPFLSVFVSLRELNLSGNSILRITSGALPRGLHTLNLSKNSISTIEGLRELTRLRVLDLSYNRIFRIGHGLASCCSLKELYLAGNKISEVEGLHRLLKLNVLDLRSNKISTTKCLGQLAANYGSLHAMNLEGNPAQRNVGDEQLKKYLVSLLPKLVYYNKQIIRVGSSKEVVVDRAHQFDRGLKSEYKHARKGNASTAHKPVTSRGRHGRVLPPTGPKGIHQSSGSRLLSLREFNMPRSMSEGTLLS